MMKHIGEIIPLALADLLDEPPPIPEPIPEPKPEPEPKPQEWQAELDLIRGGAS